MQSNPIDIYYFSGTGNTYLAVKALAGVFRENELPVTLYRIEDTDPADVNPEHTLGLAFPVAAGSTYPFVWRFIDVLPNAQRTPAFMLDTLGGMSGGIVGPLRVALEKKGYRPVGSREFRMPSNFLVMRESGDADMSLRDKSLQKVAEYARDLMSGQTKWGRIPGLSDLICLISRHRLSWKPVPWILPMVVDNEKCTGCGLCAKLCPVDNITVENDKAVMDNHCELCQRCFTYCQENAIKVAGKNLKKYRAVQAASLLGDE